MKRLNTSTIHLIAAQKRLAIFLDYDGTLTPIVSHPSLAKLSTSRKKILKQLLKLRDVKVCVISGRCRAELKKMVGVSGFIYASNHGFEIEWPDGHYKCFADRAAQMLLARITARLRKTIGRIRGVFIENKKFTVSVHYRQTPKNLWGKLKLGFLQEASPYAEGSEVVLSEGKKVMEIRPAIRWNKGRALDWILERLSDKGRHSVFPVCLGDDRTDEDSFRQVGNKGFTIKVTDHPKQFSHARYYLSSTKQVFDFLKQLIKKRNEKMRQFRCGRKS